MPHPSPAPASLVAGYRALVCDLDGVVYRGHAAIPYAVPALEQVAAAGVRVTYATNNASRTSAAVTDQLRALGLSVEAEDVLTSSRAGAAEVLARVGRGARVLAVGGPGVEEALVEAGLTPVRLQRGPDGSGVPVGQVAAVLQGYGADVSWHELAEAAYAITAGACWVATNDDATLPTARGFAPGNGALVGAVRRAVTVDPLVVGKPHPPLYRLAAEAVGVDVAETLAIGDRLDTDIAGAVAAGVDSLHVLSGVDGVAAVAAAGRGMRPTFVAWDLRTLTLPYEVPHEGPYHGRVPSGAPGGSDSRDDNRALGGGDDNAGTWICGAAVVRWPRRTGPDSRWRAGSIHHERPADAGLGENESLRHRGKEAVTTSDLPERLDGPLILRGGSLSEEMRAVVAAGWALVDDGQADRVRQAPWDALLERWARRRGAEGG